MLAGTAKLIAVALAAGAGDPCDGSKPVRVTVVSVLANSATTHIDPKLKELAREVRKREPGLTGFRVVAALQKAVDRAAYHLVGRLPNGNGPPEKTAGEPQVAGASSGR